MRSQVAVEDWMDFLFIIDLMDRWEDAFSQEDTEGKGILTRSHLFSDEERAWLVKGGEWEA